MYQFSSITASVFLAPLSVLSSSSSVVSVTVIIVALCKRRMQFKISEWYLEWIIEVTAREKNKFKEKKKRTGYYEAVICLLLSPLLAIGDDDDCLLN